MCVLLRLHIIGGSRGRWEILKVLSGCSVVRCTPWAMMSSITMPLASTDSVFYHRSLLFTTARHKRVHTQTYTRASTTTETHTPTLPSTQQTACHIYDSPSDKQDKAVFPTNLQHFTFMGEGIKCVREKRRSDRGRRGEREEEI